jgi:hypothetical protein
MSKKTILIITVVAAVVITAIILLLSLKLHQANRQNEEMTLLFEIEKEEMENEYSTFATQYDEMQVMISNDSLKVQLEREKQKTQRLLEELRNTKANDAAEITRLKKELATVRKVMRSYIVQIDSLNQANEKLNTENRQVKRQYAAATQQISSLQETAKSLSDKVTLASQLDATGFSVSTRNKRGRTTTRVKDVTSIAISFTIVKNITAQTGEKDIFVRILKPNGEVLTKGGNTFPYQNRKLEYSIRKFIEYTGEEQEVTVYWNVEEFLEAGTYIAHVFADGVMIGDKSFSLD